MVVFINAGGGSTYPNGESFTVCSSNTEVAVFRSANQPITSIRIGDDNSGNMIFSGGGTFTLAVGTSNKPSTLATINLGQNGALFGVNSLNPNYTLDVSGDINYSGRLMLNGNVISNNMSSYHDASGVQFISSTYNLAIMPGPSSTSNSLFVPYGNGTFGGQGIFGGNGQFGGLLNVNGAVTIGGNSTVSGSGIFSGAVTTPTVHTSTLNTTVFGVTFDNGAVDASSVQTVNLPLSTSIPYSVKGVGGNVYTSTYDSSQTAFVIMQNVSSLSSSNIKIIYTTKPITAVSSKNLIAFTSINQKTGGVTYNSAGTSTPANTTNHTFGDGYVMAFNSNGAFAWSTRIQGGVPSSITFSQDGRYVATTGTYSTSLVVTDAQGSLSSYGQGSPGAYIATLTSSGSLVSALTVNGFTSNIIARFDGNDGIVWGGSFSNAVTPTYFAKNYVISGCNATYTSNLEANTLYPPYAGQVLNVTLTSNIWSSNAFTNTTSSTQLSSEDILSLYVGTSSPDTSDSPSTNFGFTSNFISTPCSLNITAPFPGYSNVFIARNDLSGNSSWFSQLGCAMQPKITASRSTIYFSYGNHASSPSIVSNIGFWNYVGLSNANASRQLVSPSQMTVPSYSSTIIAQDAGGTIRFSNQVPSVISQLSVNEYDATVLLTSSTSNLLYIWDVYSGSNITTMAPLPSSLIIDVAADPYCGSLLLLGNNTSSSNVSQQYPNGDTFFSSLSAGYFIAKYPAYRMIPSTAQITQCSTISSALQVVQTGTAPVTRLIATLDSANNIIEAYSGRNAKRVFTLSSSGNIAITSNISCYNLTNQNAYVASSLSVPGVTYLNVASTSNLTTFGSTTTSNLLTQQLWCGSNYSFGGSLVGTYKGGISCMSTTFDVNSTRMSASNMVYLGGPTASTVVIAPGNVTITSNLTTTSITTSTINASSVVTTPTLNIADSASIANTLTILGGSCLYAVGNYNLSGTPFVGIGTLTNPSLTNSFALAVKGGATFDNIYTTTLTVGNNVINTTDASLLIIGGSQPSFNGVSGSQTYSFGGILPTVSKSLFGMFAGAGGMFARLYCYGVIYSQACGIGPYNVGIGTQCSANANPAYILDVNGTARISSLTVLNSIGVNTPTPNYTLEVNGNLGVTGDISAMYSDDRLKTRINVLDHALDKISRLTAFTYKNNDVAKSYGFTDDITRVGLSAQDVGSVLPEAVRMAPFDKKIVNNVECSKSGNNYITVQYEQLVPLLVTAVQELKAMIDELKKTK